MEIFKRRTKLDFMRWRRPAAVASIVVVLLSLGCVVVRGLNYTIDFTGGTLVELAFDRQVNPGEIRRLLAEGGYHGASVQHYGSATGVLVRIPERPEGGVDLGDDIVKSLAGSFDGRIEVRRIDFVGPQVGEELAEQGGLAVLISLGAILAYVAFRFEWRFAAGAVIALIHDVLITLGFFSLFWIDFDLVVLAAVLTVIGYSLNDTIVVFDRVRENFRLMRKASPLDVVNRSLNETLSRTIMTGLTTLLVLIALLLFGGPTMFGFSMALIIGIVVGTYSSIYIASAAALALGVSRSDLVVADVKEGADTDSHGGRRMPASRRSPDTE